MTCRKEVCKWLGTAALAVLLGSGCQQPFKISEKKPADRIPISDGSHFTIRQPETGRAVVETDGPVRAYNRPATSVEVNLGTPTAGRNNGCSTGLNGG